MKEEIKELWTKTLRSRKYKQGQKKLRTNEGFCCLGVLTDLYIQETGDGEWVRTNALGSRDPNGDHWAFQSSYGRLERNFLPTVVMDWAELHRSNPEILLDQPDYKTVNKTVKSEHRPSVGGRISLSDLNDGGKGFHTIARFIKKYL